MEKSVQKQDVQKKNVESSMIYTAEVCSVHRKWQLGDFPAVCSIVYSVFFYNVVGWAGWLAGWLAGLAGWAGLGWAGWARAAAVLLLIRA